MEPHGTDNECNADDAITGDHHRCEDRVASQRFTAWVSGDHQRHNQPDFDDGHSDRQHKGSVRLTDAMRNDFGVSHRGQDGPRERHCHHDLDDDAGFAPPRQREQDGCQHGDNHRP